MDHRCPNCRKNLKHKFMKVKGSPGGFFGTKILVPQCPYCKAKLVPIQDREEVVLAIIIVCWAMVLGVIGQVVDERYGNYLIAFFILGALAVGAWFKITGRGNQPRWRLFSGAGEDGGDVDPHVQRIRKLESTCFGSPEKHTPFSATKYILESLLLSAGISVIAAVMVVFPKRNSLVDCLLVSIPMTIGVFVAKALEAYFRIAYFWFVPTLMASVALFVLLGMYLYPYIPGLPPL